MDCDFGGLNRKARNPTDSAEMQARPKKTDPANLRSALRPPKGRWIDPPKKTFKKCQFNLARARAVLVSELERLVICPSRDGTNGGGGHDRFHLGAMTCGSHIHGAAAGSDVLRHLCGAHG